LSEEYTAWAHNCSELKNNKNIGNQRIFKVYS